MLFLTKFIIKGFIAKRAAFIGEYSDEDFSIAVDYEMRYDGPSAPEVEITYNHETVFYVVPNSIDQYNLYCFREGKWLKKLNRLYRIAKTNHNESVRDEYKRRFSPIN